MPSTLNAGCTCGKVALEVAGAPIMAATCMCASCQEAASRFADLPGAPKVLDADGGTEFILVRKDRVRCTHGETLMAEHRLKPDSPTRRVTATCCNAPMFLEFTNGHWLSMYRARFGPDAPPIEMRTMARDRRADVEFHDAIPSLEGHSGKFMFRLLGAWVKMGFRVPKITWGKPAA